MKKLLIIFINLILFDELKANTKWNGLTLRMQGGLYADYFQITTKDGSLSTPTGVDAMFGWGIEYSFLIKKHFYLSCDFGFPYHSQIFKGKEIKANPLIGNFVFPAFFLYFIPIIYGHLGYAWEDWVLTVGSAYLWGITTTVKRSVTNNVSVEFRHTWFFDKLTYSDGFHDMHFLFSLRYTF